MYLYTFEKELEIILAKVKSFNNKEGKETISNIKCIKDETIFDMIAFVIAVFDVSKF